MKNGRKYLALLLVLVLAMSSCMAMAEETYPTQWDLTEIYADADAWQADYDKVMEMIPQHEAYRGTLNTAQGLYDYLQFAYLGGADAAAEPAVPVCVSGIQSESGRSGVQHDDDEDLRDEQRGGAALLVCGAGDLLAAAGNAPGDD